MQVQSLSRRALLAMAGTASAVLPAAAQSESNPPAPKGPTTSTPEDRERRLRWWHEARFGMFIHFGLYSVLGRHEWAMEEEGIPVAEYEQLAKRFNPQPNAARAWAKLAKRAGMRYMVMTNLLLFMALLPIKMILRWTVNLKYFISMPEYLLNL